MWNSAIGIADFIEFSKLNLKFKSAALNQKNKMNIEGLHGKDCKNILVDSMFVKLFQ